MYPKDLDAVFYFRSGRATHTSTRQMGLSPRWAPLCATSREYRRPQGAAGASSFPRVHFDPSVGTEELGHLEMIGAIVHQLTRNLTDEEIQRCSSFAPYFVDHTTGVYPTAASGFPWTAASMAVKGDVICDLTEDLAAEQKARVTYDNILRLCDDPDVTDVIRFLREREIVHFQRFGDANLTKLNRFYPLRATAHRGSFSPFSVVQAQILPSR